MKKFASWSLLIIVCVALTAPIWVFKDLLFPFVSSKAFFFRIAVEAALPFYIYLLVADKKSRPNMRNPLTISILSFWVFSMISAFVGVGVLKSIWGNFERMGGMFYISHLILVYFYMLMLGKLYPDFLKRVLQVLIFIAVLTSLEGLFTKLGWLHILTDPSLPERVSSTFGNPIFFASFLVITMFVTIFFALREEGWVKIYYWLAALLQLWGIYSSVTRGAVAGLAIGIFLALWVYIFLAPRKKVKVYGLSIMIICSVLVAVAFLNAHKFAPGSFMARVTNLRDTNSEARLTQWQIALKGYVHRPWFGTGPENYSVIANQYFNPKMYLYDGSWFDKPHNFLLEILVTHGAFAFVSYLAVLWFAFYGLYKGYKNKLLDLYEFLVLFTCLVAYTVQNLFVFDTVSASLAFYIFIGFTGFLLESSKGEKEEKKSSSKIPHNFATVILVISIIGAAYLIYLTNYLPMVACADTNYGYAYMAAGSQDYVQKGVDFFQNAVNSSFNFDPGETASRYADEALQAGQRSADYPPGFGQQVLSDGINALEAAVARVPNNPIYWQKLSSLYLTESYLQGQLDPRAQADAQKAIDLAPGRTEANSLMAQIQYLEGNSAQAEKIAQYDFQVNPNQLANGYQLVLIYRAEKKIPQAADLMSALIDKQYPVSNFSDLSWMIDYYKLQNDNNKVMSLLQYLAKNNSQDYQVYYMLSGLELKQGNTTQALDYAQQALQYNPPTDTRDTLLKFISSNTPKS